MPNWVKMKKVELVKRAAEMHAQLEKLKRPDPDYDLEGYLRDIGGQIFLRDVAYALEEVLCRKCRRRVGDSTSDPCPMCRSLKIVYRFGKNEQS